MRISSQKLACMSSTPKFPSRPSRTRCLTIKATLASAAELEGQAKESFIISKEFLTTRLGIDDATAERYLNRAFGFGNQGYWRGENVEVTPTVEKLEEIFEFLEQEIGLETPDETAKVLKKFPEMLGQKLDDRLRANVKYYAEKWKIEGSVLKSTVLRRPEILGYNVDCVTIGDGGCLGECNRCFARF